MKTVDLAPPVLAANAGTKGLNMKLPSGGISLQANIVTYFVAVIVLTCGGITWYSYSQSTKLVLEYADQFLDNSAASTIANTDTMLAPVAAALEEIAVIGNLHPEELTDPAMQRHMLQVMLSYPSVTGVFIGFDDTGNYSQVQRIPPNARTFGATGKPLPAGSLFARRELVHGSAGVIDSYRFISRWGEETGTDESSGVTYDPRKRPFYLGAVRQHGRFLTDIYVFASNGKPGLTISFPLYNQAGKLLGVVGADITLENMSAFLRRQQIGKSGIAFIFDNLDRIVSYPDAAKNVSQSGGDITLMNVRDLGVRSIADAFAKHHGEGLPRFTFTSGGVDYIASFQSFPSGFGKDWSIAVIVPVDDFVGSIKTTNNHIVLASVIIVVLAIGAAHFLARRIAHAILGLTVEASKIRDFRLDGEITIRSHITEISQLIGAMATMKSAIFAFSRYVPRGLVQQLLQSGRGTELGGQDQTLTLMFTDLENFSQFSEHMPARRLMLLVSEHLDVVTRMVLANSGTVDKFIGDSVMAFWGAPLPQEDHAYNACVTALMVQCAMDDMNANPTTPGQPVLNARIGLHTDQVIVGNIGSYERMSYTALGDGVNLASRLEGVNKVYHTRILISDAVLRRAGEGRVVARPLDHVAVKGRQGGVTIYELLGVREEGKPISATAAQIRLAEVATRAFTAYMARLWEEAIDLYGEIQELRPGDYPSALLAARCRERAAAPSADWNCVHELKEK